MAIEKPYLLFLGDVRDALAAKTAFGVVDWTGVAPLVDRLQESFGRP